MINVSPCKKSDYDVLSQIEKSIFQDPISKIELKNFEEQPAYKIWKIEEKKIVGFVSFFHVKDEIEIIKICIIKVYFLHFLRIYTYFNIKVLPINFT